MLDAVLSYMRDPANRFGAQTLTTLQLTLVPLVLALLLALPLGVLVARRPLVAAVAVNFSGLARAVPTLVFLAVMLPVLGTGVRPGIVAMTAMGIPPILLNTVAGLRGIDPAAIDAARGMGMTPWQVLARIQIPLVLPVLAAGVRTAAVQVAATTPLAALIGAGGYGDYILQGINNMPAGLPALLAGAISVAALALALEALLAYAQRALTPQGLRQTQESAAPSTGPARLAA